MNLGERNPQAAMKTSNNKFTYYQVNITGIDTSKIGQYNADPLGIALTVDRFAVQRQIGVSTYVGSGACPQVGEDWTVDQTRGAWTFVSRLTQVVPQASNLKELIMALQQLGLVSYTGNLDDIS